VVVDRISQYEMKSQLVPATELLPHLLVFQRCNGGRTFWEIYQFFGENILQGVAVACEEPPPMNQPLLVVRWARWQRISNLFFQLAHRGVVWEGGKGQGADSNIRRHDLEVGSQRGRVSRAGLRVAHLRIRIRHVGCETGSLSKSVGGTIVEADG